VVVAERYPLIVNRSAGTGCGRATVEELWGMRVELDLTEEEFEDQFASYGEHLRRFHSLPGGVP
jgi:hypothetical protein